MKMKRQPTERANIFAHHMSGKSLVSNAYKNFYSSQIKRQLRRQEKVVWTIA